MTQCLSHNAFPGHFYYRWERVKGSRRAPLWPCLEQGAPMISVGLMPKWLVTNEVKGGHANCWMRKPSPCGRSAPLKCEISAESSQSTDGFQRGAECLFWVLVGKEGVALRKQRDFRWNVPPALKPKPVLRSPALCIFCDLALDSVLKGWRNSLRVVFMDKECYK